MQKELKRVMKEKNVSGYRLAKLTGISAPDIYRAINGKQEMFKGWKLRIADALDCTVEELFPENEELKRLKAERKRIDEKIKELTRTVEK